MWLNAAVLHRRDAGNNSEPMPCLSSVAGCLARVELGRFDVDGSRV
ncbi:hypothetical protein RE6C_03770 [Rhodopirellula europaea 6C]|uniref:Uncharacterized protein n=1 Tax=Rhodopirellula europaea 6C TaxID=1263867 RepID=M2A5L0_9BACT|nr:hypothetical protein RE6C_03770 [Rhodopirellula europaea 6C]